MTTQTRVNILFGKQVHISYTKWLALLVLCIKGHEIDVVDCCVPAAHQELANEVEFHFFFVHVHHSGLGKTDTRKNIHEIRITGWIVSNHRCLRIGLDLLVGALKLPYNLQLWLLTPCIWRKTLMCNTDNNTLRVSCLLKG